jgi:hypothetical protein
MAVSANRSLMVIFLSLNLYISGFNADFVFFDQNEVINVDAEYNQNKCRIFGGIGRNDSK